MTRPVPNMRQVPAWFTSSPAYWVLAGPRNAVVALVWHMPVTGRWTAVRFTDGARLWGGVGDGRVAVGAMVFTAPLRPQPPSWMTVLFVRRRFNRMRRHGGMVFVAGCDAAARVGLVDGTASYARFVTRFYRAHQLLPV